MKKQDTTEEETMAVTSAQTVKTTYAETPAKLAKEELAEWQFNGCMICGAPGGSLMATVEVVGSGAARIREDGTTAAPDFNEEYREVRDVFCSECGAVIWNK